MQLTDHEWMALAALRAARDFIQTVDEDADQRRVLKRVNDAIASIERKGPPPEETGVEYDEDHDHD